jgi:serine/threonine protein kinase/tetratricopeptide (TPR) repeat protein
MIERLEREVEIFNTARQLPAANRAAYLDGACAGDPALRQHVEGLLQAGEAAGGFLQEPAPGAQRPAEGAGSVNSRPGVAAPTEKVGDRIGRYKLLQQIGEGGCGVVYMAEQEEPVRRRVALKVIKLGMDTKQVIARFEAERQALALMDHPNIARVFDAGATETGRPFFVMELVRGQRITDYCAQNSLPVTERLDLFVQVCRAIQHAHQKGIIHRDIKPSNILVTINDGVAVPKVIDFGIAKATQGRLTDQTVFTAFEQFIGTPAYMSPEQAVMTSLDVDTRSDIYSLGVLLYELLTGRTPFDTKELLAAGLDEMRRTIREVQPVRPSTRLTQEFTAQSRCVNNSALRTPHSAIDKDLDWIVMKCLEKDRARRYDTANGLAMDIQRHLHCEPVVARPPSRVYEFQKSVRRHKLGFAATGAVTAALVIGLAVSLELLVKEKAAVRRATAAEKKAETAAGKSQQVAGLLRKMLKSAGPSVTLGRDATILREILDGAARSVSQELTNQPEVAVELCLILADAYHDLGMYQEMEGVARQGLRLARTRPGEESEGVASSLISLGDALQHLGELQPARLEEAEQCCRAGLEMNRKLLGSENLIVATGTEHLANIQAVRGRLDEGERMEREAMAMYEKLLGHQCSQVAKALFDLSITVAAQPNRLAEAENLAREALGMQRKLLGEVHPEVAKTLNQLGSVLFMEGKLVEAEAVLREALGMWQKLQAKDRPEIVRLLADLGNLLIQRDTPAEGEAKYREALAMERSVRAADPDEVNLLYNLANAQSLQGKWDEAEATYREALAIQRKRFGNEHAEVATALGVLANGLQRRGKLSQAEATYREALALQRKLPGDEFAQAWVLDQLAGVLEEQGRLEEAVAARREALPLFKKSYGEEGPAIAEPTIELASLLARLTLKDSESEAYASECLTLIGSTKATNDWRLFGIRSDLGASLLAQKKFTEAEPLLLSGYGGLKQYEEQIPTNAVARLAEAAERLVQLCEATGQLEKAANWRQQWTLAQSAPEAATRRATGIADGRHGRFAEAAAELARVIELRPEEYHMRHLQAAALLQTGQIEAYRELCHDGLERFGTTTNYYAADQIAKDVLVLPVTGADLETAARMAETAVNAPTNNPDLAWFRFAKGLAEYRLEHYASTAEWMRRVLADAGREPNRDAEACIVLAMAQHQLKQPQEARASLTRGMEIVETKMFKLEGGNLGDNWDDWVFAHVLLDEAKALMQLQSTALKE